VKEYCCNGVRPAAGEYLAVVVANFTPSRYSSNVVANAVGTTGAVQLRIKPFWEMLLYESVTPGGGAIGVESTPGVSENPFAAEERTMTEYVLPLMRPVMVVPLVSGTPGVHSVSVDVVVGRYQRLCSVTDVVRESVHVAVTAPSDGVTRSNVAAAGFVSTSTGTDASEHPRRLQALMVME
jgi:hypothetical protein